MKKKKIYLIGLLLTMLSFVFSLSFAIELEEDCPADGKIEMHQDAFCKNNPDKNCGYCKNHSNGGISCTESENQNSDCYDIGY